VNFSRNRNSTLFNTLFVVRRALKVLNPRDRLKALYVVFIYGFLGILDIAAVFVFGLVGSLAVSGVSSNRPGIRVNTFLEFLGIADENLQTQVSILGLIAASVLVFKSFASLYLSKRTLFFLSRRSAIISRILLNKLLDQEMLRVRGRTIQETIFALTTGVQAVTVSILGSSLLLIADIFLIVAFSISLFLVDTLVALLSLTLFSTIGILMYSLMHRKAQRLGELATKLEISSSDKISEVVSCYRELSVKNRRNFYAQEIGEMRHSIAEAGANLGVMSLLSKYIMEITMVVGGLAIGAAQFIAQPATRAVAVISIFLISSARIAPAILRIQTGLITIRTNIGTAKPTLDLIEEYLKEGIADLDPVEGYKGREYFKHTGFSSHVTASNVSFTYPNRKKEVISNLELNIKEGEFVGIVGPSGSGKTTLVDLLLGVIHPEFGAIKISGSNPAEIIQKWPGAIAYVPQETSIINGSIKENICLGYLASEVPDEVIIELLRDVQLEEFLTMPGGIHSSTGERGSKLSGGQKQRIGLARALFTNPKLLVLDEATSALDATTEKKITSFLTSIKGTLTIIVIAHRLSTVKDADKVIYMKGGRVLGEGPFEELRGRIPEFDSQAKAMGL
jgi:ABC-type multidrug transport system fused ATPase/permease subunit